MFWIKKWTEIGDQTLGVMRLVADQSIFPSIFIFHSIMLIVDSQRGNDNNRYHSSLSSLGRKTGLKSLGWKRGRVERGLPPLTNTF